MFDANRASSGNVHGTSDSSLGMEDPPNLTNQDRALSLTNLNNNMGNVASLLTKLCKKPQVNAHRG